jgi:PEGA domain
MFIRSLMLMMVPATFVCIAADTGSLKTRVEPGRAGVFIDGKYAGPAANFGMARTYAVAAGEHEVRLVEPRYEDAVTKVTITAGKKATITEKLKALPAPKPPFGAIRTEHADHMAAVYVNDRYMGHVDEFSNPAQKLLLNPGTYEVKIVPVGAGSPVTKTVTVEAHKTVIVK